MNLADMAVRYAERGLPVFPVRGKLPLTEHGFKDASTDVDTIRGWYERWPDANVAIPTGPASGLVVLDVDPRHDGGKSLAALEEKHGPLPLTLEVRTGGGGRHLFFALGNEQNVRNSAGKLGPGLDVRGDGGYIVAPPSIHPETKQPYVWTNKIKPAQTPAWLIRELSAPAAISESVSGAPIPAGQRNDTLTRIAGAMRRKGCTPEAIEAALLAENARRCSSPLPEQEVRSIAQSVSRYAPGPGAAETRSVEAPSGSEERQRTEFSPAFPKAAWRGVFADYRAAMQGATEASDVFHFAALWTRCAVALGRNVSFPYGMSLYPNVYLLVYGPTGDRKTTATRKATELGDQFKVVSGGGSGEGLADDFSGAEPGHGFLLHAEEFSQILRPGRWEGATLIPFLTQCFDCPDRYEMKFRKAPISLERPTPSLLAGATPEWFWQDFRTRDFQGGFGNRLFFLTGARKPVIALPDAPDLSKTSRAVNDLSIVEPCRAHFAPNARTLWEQFYLAWDAEEDRRDPLLLAAVKRIPAYIIKLGMVYASSERTLPEITLDQLSAAILVGRYGEVCARELLSLQNAGTNPKKELERRILAFVRGEPGWCVTKRATYKALWRHYSDAEAFHRAFDSLVRAGELFTRSMPRGRVEVSIESFE
jgi:Bifunctional DNA primase/polymerase, N-terminal/Primase C terminal 1 (PriCT-1)